MILRTENSSGKQKQKTIHLYLSVSKTAKTRCLTYAWDNVLTRLILYLVETKTDISSIFISNNYYTCCNFLISECFG